MRLNRFEIKNFKVIQAVSLDFQDLTVLIGENNCGKSCVLLALSWFLSGAAIKDESLFHKYETGPDNAIELIGHFNELSDQDKNEVAIMGRMHGDEWILKKRYWFERGTAGVDRGSWKELLYSYSSEDIFVGWPDADTAWNAFPRDYQTLIEQIPNRGPRPNADSRAALKDLVRRQRPDLVQQTAPTWVENPGGGGNWKSNANSIIPHPIYVRAVHDASDESISKDASTYGKLINLIVEKQLSNRQEVQDLKTRFDAVMELFRPDEAHPEHQAQEIRDLQNQITDGLNSVISGRAVIKTQPIELHTLLLPSTSLVIRDLRTNVETEVKDQGHGLQRTLIMTLLKLLAKAQNKPPADDATARVRPTILIIEEPELYMHPQMERRMRDVLYEIAAQDHLRVACSTHSPVFLDIADKYKSITRLVRDRDGVVTSYQVTEDLFSGRDDQSEKERLQTVSRFNPAVNELFFSSQVVLFEEFSAIAAFERAADLVRLFTRHPEKRREITAVDCNGKANIPAFQRILNAFRIPYRVVHDEDRNNPQANLYNARIAAQADAANPVAATHLLSPDNLESVLGFQAGGAGRPYAAVKKVEELNQNGNLPPAFIEAMNFVYFGMTVEPAR